ncbi:MAG: caspase family protein, partial [Pseudomonadota bacterium]
MLTHWIRWSLAWFVILLFSTMLYDANAQPRIATIIGNADYVVEKLELRNPVNDANLMASTVSGLGFDVRLHTNLSRDEMLRVFNEHRERLEAAGPSAIGLFYYAGHGMQVNGKNHLIPVNTRARFREDALAEPQLGVAISLMEQAGNAVNLIVLDACNDNPLPARSGLGRSAGTDNGLAGVPRSAGLLIAYAAQPGRTAADGAGANS